MPVRCVHSNGVYLCRLKRAYAVKRIAADAYRRAHEQPPVLVLCGMRILYGLFYVLYGYQALEYIVIVNNGQFFYAVLAEYLLRLLKRRAHGRGNQIVLCHYVGNLLVVIGFKAQVAVGEYAHQLAALCRDGYAGYAVFFHERHRLVYHVFR